MAYLPGWHTTRHLVIFESDDWGSIRMPSISAFRKLEKQGLDLRSADAERYNLNDSLETSSDLENLFEVLSGARDKNNNNAVFTPVTIVANPDFKKIKETGFREYYYEPFTLTYKRFRGCENSFELLKEGIRKKIFVPQMHGREHLNVTAWMKALQSGETNTLHAFEEGLWGFVPANFPVIDYQAAYLLNDKKDMSVLKSIITEGIKLFKDLFGFKPVYFVPPNGHFNNALNETLSQNEIQFRSVAQIQRESLGAGRSRRVYHYLGQKDQGIKYITRNCIFEPGKPNIDWVDRCLKDIKFAFSMYKPAIISSHRVNYIGALNPANRDQGLKDLAELLRLILKTWPYAEFMSTAQLGALINKN